MTSRFNVFNDISFFIQDTTATVSALIQVTYSGPLGLVALLGEVALSTTD